jgi:hypothetical protein
MNTPQLRRHLEQVYSAYREMVENDRLEDLARELGERTWMPSLNGSMPNAVLMEATNKIMAELQSAAAKRNKSAARTTLDRFRRFIRLIGPSVASP